MASVPAPLLLLLETDAPMRKRCPVPTPDRLNLVGSALLDKSFYPNEQGEARVYSCWRCWPTFQQLAQTALKLRWEGPELVGAGPQEIWNFCFADEQVSYQAQVRFLQSSRELLAQRSCWGGTIEAWEHFLQQVQNKRKKSEQAED